MSLSANNTFDSTALPNPSSNANQYSQENKNSTQMAGDEKIISQPPKLLDGDFEEKEKQDNNYNDSANQTTRARPSVFRMVKRFENRDTQPNTAVPLTQIEETKKTKRR